MTACLIRTLDPKSQLVYCISLNRRHPLVAAQLGALSEQIRHPRIVATATIRCTCTCTRIISADGHGASTKTVHVVQLVSTGTERLHLLLTTSSSCHCIARVYLIHPPLMSVGFFQRKKRRL